MDVVSSDASNNELVMQEMLIQERVVVLIVWRCAICQSAEF